MLMNVLRLVRPCFLLISACVILSVSSIAAEPDDEGDWQLYQDPVSGIYLRTMELTVTPRAEPVPALRYRFIPSDDDLIDGNAAIYYLQAMGFIEHDATRSQVTEFHRKHHEESVREKKKQAAPDSWLEIAPGDFPQQAVRDYLKLLKFQEHFLLEAAKRRHFDMDRQIHDVEDPIAYLIPEIQQMRQLARTQSLRCRLAISEGRIDDAIRILGQQFAAARHLSQDHFLVTHLVAAAIVGMHWGDALHLAQHPQAPNLYWAYAALPRPLVDIRKSVEYEARFLYHQFKLLQEVDEVPRPVGFWQDFVDRLTPKVRAYSGDLFPLINNSNDLETVRFALVNYLAAAYPGAKDYLITRCAMSPEQVDAYPTAQTVFLAMKKFYERISDDHLKWAYVPYWQAIENGALEDTIEKEADKLGWGASFPMLLAGPPPSVFTAQARAEQKIAMSQTIEAIRLYGAEHHGRLPPSLAALPVPVPLDPSSGQPFQYVAQGNKAVLTGHPFAGHQWRLVVRFAPATPTP